MQPDVDILIDFRYSTLLRYILVYPVPTLTFPFLSQDSGYVWYRDIKACT